MKKEQKKNKNKYKKRLVEKRKKATHHDILKNLSGELFSSLALRQKDCIKVKDDTGDADEIEAEEDEEGGREDREEWVGD